VPKLFIDVSMLGKYLPTVFLNVDGLGMHLTTVLAYVPRLYIDVDGQKGIIDY
jgi:hypothetical protein